jgi:hypothetical protein
MADLVEHRECDAHHFNCTVCGWKTTLTAESVKSAVVQFVEILTTVGMKQEWAK